MTKRLVLAFDTATSPGGVAVGSSSDGAALAAAVLEHAPHHSERIMPAIEDVLRTTGATMRDVAAIVVGAGPGSFTGVRIAAASAKALSHARGIPLHAFPSLQAAVYAAGADDYAVCALFDARRGEAYAGCWQTREGMMEALLEPTADRVETIVAQLATHAPLYVGDGALRNRDAIEEAGGRVGAAHATQHCARALLTLYARANGAGLVADPAHWQPTYVRPPNVTVPTS